jgi:hypothetical protein
MAVEAAAVQTTALVLAGSVEEVMVVAVLQLQHQQQEQPIQEAVGAVAVLHRVTGRLVVQAS